MFDAGTSVPRDELWPTAVKRWALGAAISLPLMLVSSYVLKQYGAPRWVDMSATLGIVIVCMRPFIRTFRPESTWRVGDIWMLVSWLAWTLVEWLGS